MNREAAAARRYASADILEAALLAAVGYVGFGYYEVVGRLAALRGSDFSRFLHTRLDDAIPFLPVFVLPYALAFVLPAVVAVFVARLGGLFELRRVFFAYLGLLFLHFAFYLAVPTSAAGVMLAPSAVPAGILSAGVLFFYRLAPPWNAFPSFHVAGGWFFYRVLARWKPRAARVYRAWFWLMFVGTVAIKIHWLADGAAGWLLAEAWHRFVAAPMEARGACAWTWSSTRLRLAAHAIPLVLLGAGLGLALRALR